MIVVVFGAINLSVAIFGSIVGVCVASVDAEIPYYKEAADCPSL